MRNGADAVGWFKDLFSRKSTEVEKADDTGAWQRSASPAGGVTLSNELYATEAAVRTVTSFIADNVASMPVKAYRKLDTGDRVEADGSRLSLLLKQPSVLPGVTRYQLFRSLLLDGLLNDRYAAIVANTDGRLWLRRIPPRCFDLQVNAAEEVTGLNVTLDGSTRTIALPNSAVLLGIGYGADAATPIPATLRSMLQEAKELADYRRSIAKNAGRMSAYVYTPAGTEVSDDEIESFAHAMREYTNGGARQGGMPMLFGGAEIRGLDTFKPCDVNDLQARTDIAIQVCNAYHISPENVGYRTGTKSNVSEYKQELWSVELMPYICAFEEQLNAVLPAVTGEPDLYVELSVDAKLRGTLETQYQAFSTASGRSFLTTNEVRRMMNRPAVPGGDDLVTPLNVLTGSQPSPQDGGRTLEAQEGTNR
nr:phage portal protein [Bifidobacterium miconisargentati]